jgi:AraC-like DNA-binding protein
MQPILSDHDVRVATMMAIPRLLEELGADPAALLAEFDLPPDHFDNPDNTIGAGTVGRLLGRCVEETECAHFGLLVGERAGASALGPVGFLMQSAPDVGTALRKLIAGFHTHDRAGTVELREEGGYAFVTYTLLQHGLEHVAQILDLAIAIAQNVIRGLCGSQWQATEVRLAHRRPHDAGVFRRHFGVAPVFDAEWSGLAFPSNWLAMRTSGADKLLHAFMELRVQELIASSGADLPGKVRRVIRRSISIAECSLESVARELKVSGRTLNRRLREHGTTFRDLREEVRFDAACQLIAHTRLTATEVAASLGYADASAFTRAFERWSGTTPARWRIAQARKRPRRQPAP